MTRSIKLPIHTDSISLTQALKRANVVPTGGQAKKLIEQGTVKVNGVPEYRRHRKLQPGDVIHIEPLAVILEIQGKEVLG